MLKEFFGFFFAPQRKKTAADLESHLRKPYFSQDLLL